MKASAALFLLACLAAPAHSSPIAKVLEMVGDLEAKIIGEGGGAQKIYAAASEFCEDKSKELGFEIKTGKAEVEDLTATIESKTSEIETLSAKIEDLGGSLASGAADLKAATTVREKDAAVFAAEEKELNEAISMVGRAIGILERELSKSGASMMQMQNAASLTDALSVIVKAAGFSSADAGKLSSMIQSDQDADETGAPAAAVYKGSSGNIVDTLQSMLDKADAKLADIRKTETGAVNNYQMLKQTVEGENKNAQDNMDSAKKNMAEAGEVKSVAEGDLAGTSKDLNQDIADLEELHKDCMAKASDFEAETKSRDEELAALAKAKSIIKEATSNLQTETTSFLQTGRSLSDSHAARFLRELAVKQNSPELAQLAQRMSSAFRFGGMAGEDPFAKVKSLITDMIAKLEAAAEADATQKSWCDKELRETTEKKEDKDGEIEAFSTKVDEMSSQSAKLKEETTTLQKELSELAASQGQMDKVREAEKGAYDTNQAEVSKGLEGIKNALKVLTEYYAGKDSGAGSGIISLLEVCESDFSKGLAEIEATEASAVDEYESETKANEITKTTKDQDVKYKTKESTGLDKSVAETSADREGVQAELEAVMEYFARIKDKCIAKPETYEEQVKRRTAEIAGCKEALSILEGEAALIQKRSARRTLRGGVMHPAL